MEQSPKSVAITGASGYVGARLLRKLEDEEDISKLVAIDSLPPAVPIRNMAAYRTNVTEPIDDALSQHNVSTVVHLAFIARRGRNRQEVDSIREANLAALGSVLESSARAGVNHIVYLSSHTVYGAHADNPVPLTDEAPLRPMPDFPYGYDKFLSEQMLQEFQETHPDIAVTILRSCMVLGPSAGNYITKAFFRPWLLGVIDYDPPLQFVYEDDLARILTIVIQRRLPGVFNVAGDGVVFYKEFAEMIKSRLINLPAFLAYGLAQMSWNLHIQRESTSCGLDLVRYPMVLSTGKLHQATGYRFWHTSMETLSAFANSGLLYQDRA
jgi:UDP-glucose 4-epimerase